MEFDERELIAEFFPGTDPKLFPPGEVLYYRDDEGRVVIEEAPFKAVFEPVKKVHPPRPLICEACKRPVRGADARFFRVRVARAEGEVYRYVALCEATAFCRERARPASLRKLLLKGILP